MTDLPSSLGIEAVELLSEGGPSVTVRVTGRWRRRRGEPRGQAMLVVDGPSGLQRFLAMPEPPSLAGAAPGTWRMSFSVPATLAPSLPGRTFLQVGGIVAPLPIGEVSFRPAGAEPAPPEAPAAAVPSAAPVDPDLLEARRARSSELAAESARRRAAELAAEVQRLERELGDAREETARLRSSIVDRERQLRATEQHVHSEEALRVDLEQELSRRTRAARHDLATLHERVAELERELTRMRRAVDEAGHLAAAAEAARAEAERRLAEPPAPAPAAPPPAPVAPAPASTPSAEASARASSLRREFELRGATPAPPPPTASPPPPDHAGDRLALRQEAAMTEVRAAHAGADAERVEAVERELAVAREEVATLREELAAQREEVEAQRARTARAYEAIEFVRGELRQLRAAPPAQGSSIQASAVPGPTSAAAPAAGPVQPERLSEALARLRERTPPAAADPADEPAAAEPTSLPAPPSAPDRPVRPWLGDVFRSLAAQDPTMAGHLLLALLPAQRAADPRPIAYDLVLSDVLSAHVTVDRARTYVEIDPTTRPLTEVDFQLVGDLARTVRLLTAGPVRRRLGPLAPGRRMARLRGDRGRLASLDRLIEARLTLVELAAAGVELDPLLALTVAALMIEPEWTAGERFTLAHQPPGDPAPDSYLHVRDGRPPLASVEAPHGPVASVLESPAGDLLGVLAGVNEARQLGEARPLALLRQWLDRAQSG